LTLFQNEIMFGCLVNQLVLLKLMHAIFNILLLNENITFTTLRCLVYDQMRCFMINRKFT